MSAAKKGQGGLIALSVEEADLLIEWFDTAATWKVMHASGMERADLALLSRVVQWRARHVSAGAIDGD